ncbi:MAG: hypothetical protein ACLGIS_16375, partial [Actinomycetes bacterium]
TRISEIRHELAAMAENIRSNGGGRLAAIDADIARLGNESATQRTRYQTYAAAAAELGLDDPEDRVLFDGNRDRLAAVESALAEQNTELQEQRTELTMTRTVLEGRAADIKAELTSLQSRRNLLPLDQVAIRRRLCEGSGVPEKAVPFVGELLRVRDGEAAWEGAAERTLRGFALSLLVPAEHYAAVSSWVDSNNLKGKLVYLRVGDSHSPTSAQPGTLAAKIAIKQGTPFRDFLLEELAGRFDYVCCETMADFRRFPKALTANGQLKGGRGRHEKDDRKDIGDRRNYILGWDNQDKINRFLMELEEAKGQLQVAAAQLARVDGQLGGIGRKNQQLGTVRSVADFGEISWEATARRIEELKEERRALESASNVLQELAAREAALKLDLQKFEERANKIQQRIGENRKDSENLAEAIAECQAVLAEQPLTDDAGLLASVADLAAAARRELLEEVGLDAVVPAHDGIFDVDIHDIP